MKHELQKTKKARHTGVFETCCDKCDKNYYIDLISVKGKAILSLYPRMGIIGNSVTLVTLVTPHISMEGEYA